MMRLREIRTNDESITHPRLHSSPPSWPPPNATRAKYAVSRGSSVVEQEVSHLVPASSGGGVRETCCSCECSRGATGGIARPASAAGREAGTRRPRPLAVRG